MTATHHNARYTKLRRQVGKVNFYVRNLVWGCVSDLCLLGSRANLLSHGLVQKKIVCKSFVEFLGITSNQPHVLALYV